jgi:hypothetical protein
MGRKSSKLHGFDFLGSGITLLFFHISGKIDLVIHEFNKKVMYCDITGKSNLINLIGISSIPAALL